MKTVIAILFIICTFGLSAQQPGSLDINFNSSGYVTTHVKENGASKAADLIVLSDNSVIMVGNTYITPQRYFSLVKYLDNGMPDNSFGENGIVLLDIGLGDDYATCISKDNDEKLVVAGYSFNGNYNDFSIARLTSNGAIDETFCDSGMLVMPTGKSDSYINDVKILADNSIIIAGKAFITDNYDFTLYKLQPNGKPDSTFGVNGFVSFNFGSSYDEAIKVQLLENDKLLVGGTSFNGLTNDVTLARFTNTGTLDSTFNKVGFYSWDFEERTNTFSDMAVGSDGSIYVTGTTTIPGFYAAYISKFSNDGVIDSTFASNGVLSYPIAEINTYGVSLYIDKSNDDVYTCGYSQLWGQDIIVVKFNNFGYLDSNFGTEGIWSYNFGNDVTSKGCAVINLKSNGKIILGGAIDNNGNEFLLIQLNNKEKEINGLDELASTNEFKIFPNPASEYINIEMEDVKNIGYLEIFDINGKKVLQRIIRPNNQILLDELTMGTYFIRIIQGNDVNTQKLIVK